MTKRSYRREVLSTVGALTGGGVLAGSDHFTGEATANHQNQTGVVDVWMSNWVGRDDPTNLHFSQYNKTDRFPFSPRLIGEPTTHWHHGRNEFVHWAITDWGMVDDTTFEFSIDTDITWENGDTLTTQDVVTQLRLEEATGSELWDYADLVKPVDDETIQINLPDGGNPQLIKIFLNGKYLDTKHSEYGQYLDAVGEDHDEELRRELLSETPQDPISNGPFAVKDIDDRRLTLNRRAEYHVSQNVNFSGYQMRHIDRRIQVWQELLGSNIDAVWSLFTPRRIFEDFPESIVIARIPAYWGYGLLPQHDHQHAGDLAVRKAIMHAIDREQITQYPQSRMRKTPEIPTCIATDTLEDWIGDSMDDFESYGKAERQTERATQILEDAGYSRNDGTWEDSDGTTVSLPITVQQGLGEWISVTQTVVDQLNQFGFEASIDTRADSHAETLDSGNFTLAAWSWLPGGVRGSHPYFDARHQFRLADDGPGDNYSAPDEAVEAIDALSTATDREEIRSLVRDLATTVNEELPMLQMIESHDQSFVNTERFEAPEGGSEKYQVKWPSSWLVRTGEIYEESGFTPGTGEGRSSNYPPKSHTQVPYRETRPSDNTGPGFGIVSAIAGLAGAGYLRRRNSDEE